MAPRSLIPLLVGLMLLTGVCNTLLTKYQDNQCVRDCDDPDPKKHILFEQPVLQTAQMFVGEMGCWLVVAISSIYSRILPRSSSDRGDYTPVNSGLDPDAPDSFSADPSPSSPTTLKPPYPSENGDRIPLTGTRILQLAIPACCDITGTTLMNIGLLFVAASIYQMTRGALVLFVGLFSVIFLRRHLAPHQWISLLIVVTGVAIVGLAGIIATSHTLPDQRPGSIAELKHFSLLHRRSSSANVTTASTSTPLGALFGVLLIATAQIFTATQFVLEEHLLSRYSLPPLSVVGYEGLFGLLLTLLSMIVLHLTIGTTPSGRYGYFDAVEGWHQLTTSRPIAVSSLLIMVSIGGFNFFGLSVTRTVSATSRSTIDTCRTLFIWIISLGLGWERFEWLQVLGFAGLVYGTLLFNGIIAPPRIFCCSSTGNQSVVDRGLSESELLPDTRVEVVA